jgi:hypothetical protein
VGSIRVARVVVEIDASLADSQPATLSVRGLALPRLAEGQSTLLRAPTNLDEENRDSYHYQTRDVPPSPLTSVLVLSYGLINGLHQLACTYTHLVMFVCPARLRDSL